MKRILTATALCGSLATAAVADTSQRTKMTADQLRNDAVISSQSATTSSGAGIVIPIILLVVIAAAISGGSGGSSSLHDSMYASDKRLKTDLRKVGVTPSGLGIYRFRYKGHDQLFEGVLAQDVQRLQPDAVVEGAQGFLLVDYSKIDAEMRAIR